MGLLDKFKEIFTEPVDDDEEKDEEVRVEQIKHEPKEKPAERRREKIDIEERQDRYEDVTAEFEDLSEKKPPVEPKEETLKTPVFFTEKDFADLEPEPERPRRMERHPEERVETPPQPKREEKKAPYSGHYTGTYTSPTLLTKEKSTFKPTPIISPIYGILDKNYSKEDIVERKDVQPTVVSDGMVQDRFDEVRSKAYGTLENELEETIYDERRPSREPEDTPKEDVDLFDELEKEQGHKVSLEDTAELTKTVNEQEKNIRELEEITMDLTKELDNLLLKKESFNAKKEKVEGKHQVEEDDEPLTENELFNLIDSMYEEGKEDD